MPERRRGGNRFIASPVPANESLKIPDTIELCKSKIPAVAAVLNECSDWVISDVRAPYELMK